MLSNYNSEKSNVMSIHYQMSTFTLEKQEPALSYLQDYQDLSVHVPYVTRLISGMSLIIYSDALLSLIVDIILYSTTPNSLIFIPSKIQYVVKIFHN